MPGFKGMMKKDMEDEEEEEDMSENESDMPMSDYKPCLYLDSNKYPEVSKMKLGDKVTREFRVKSRTVSDSDKGQTSNTELELI